MRFKAASGILPGIFVAIFLHILAAYFSVGWEQQDEYFQTIEFAAHSLGRVSAEDLPYEYDAMARSWLQPWIFTACIKIAEIVQPMRPFFSYFFCRLVMSLLAVAATLSFARTVMKHEISRGQYIGKLWWWMVLCPFFYMLHPRTSSENLSATFLLYASSLLLQFEMHFEKSQQPQLKQIFCAFILLGFGFWARFQLCFALAGAFLWLFYRFRSILVNVVALAGFLAVLPIGTLLDRFGYGQWTFSPWNYFYMNIFKGVAAQFGVMPFWGYGTLLFTHNNSALAALLIAATLVFLWRRSTHLMNWITVSFVLGHSFIGHKEWRFLYPIGPFVMVMFYLEIQRLINFVSSIKFRNMVYVFCFAITFQALVRNIFLPKDYLAKMYEAMSKEKIASKQPPEILFQNKSDPVFGATNDLLPRYLIGPMSWREAIPTDTLQTLRAKASQQSFFVLAEGDGSLPFLQEMRNSCHLLTTNDLQSRLQVVGQFAPKIWDDYWQKRKLYIRELFVCRA